MKINEWEKREREKRLFSLDSIQFDVYGDDDDAVEDDDVEEDDVVVVELFCFLLFSKSLINSNEMIFSFGSH